MDISRVLSKPSNVLAPYDAPSPVIHQLKKSEIWSIQIIGRRGAVQSSFTIKEIRELSRIPRLKIYAIFNEFKDSLNEESNREMHADFNMNSRAVIRKTEFLKESCIFLNNEDQVEEVKQNAYRD